MPDPILVLLLVVVILLLPVLLAFLVTFSGLVVSLLTPSDSDGSGWANTQGGEGIPRTVTRCIETSTAAALVALGVSLWNTQQHLRAWSAVQFFGALSLNVGASLLAVAASMLRHRNTESWGRIERLSNASIVGNIVAMALLVVEALGPTSAWAATVEHLHGSRSAVTHGIPMTPPDAPLRLGWLWMALASLGCLLSALRVKRVVQDHPVPPQT